MSDKRKFRRIVNFRFFLFNAVCIGLSIFFAWLYFLSSMIAIFLLVLLLLFIISLFFYRRETDGNPVKLVAFVVAFILSLLTFITFIVQVHAWTPDFFVSGKSYVVSGSIDSNTLKYGQRIVVLDNVTLDGKEVSGKIRVYLTETGGIMELAKEGDIISFSSTVAETNIIRNYAKNHRYYASIKNENVTLKFGTPSFFQRIRLGIRSLLFQNMDSDSAEISYSMITGDKNNLPVDVADYFRVAGIAHIMAVSGLHINFLLMLLIIPLKKIRVNRWLVLAIVEAVLIFYALIADLAPCVIRAIIMSTITLVTTILGKEKDSLNNLCCAICILLIFRPLNLFNVGFLLSISSVFGIILFYSAIVNALMRIHLPKFLASTIAMTLSAMIGILPVSIFFFLYFTPYSLITNVMLAYVVMISFMLLICGVILASIFSKLGFVIRLGGFGISIIDKVAEFISTLPFAKIAVFTFLPIFFSFVLYFIISRFTRKDKCPRLISIGCVILCLVMLFSFNVSYNTKNTITPVSTALYDVTSIVNVNGKVYAIGDVASATDVSRSLISVRARRLDAVFISKLNEKTAQQLINLSRYYDGFDVYFPLSSGASGIELIVNKFELFGFETSAELRDKIHSEYSGGKFVCYKLVDQTTTIFVPLSVSVSNLPSALVNSADIIRSFEDVHPYGGISLLNQGASQTSESILIKESKSLIFNYKTFYKKTVRN